MINYKKLKSQIVRHDETRGKGYMFIADREQQGFISSIYKAGSKRSLIKVLEHLIHDDEFYSEFFLY